MVLKDIIYSILFISIILSLLCIASSMNSFNQSLSMMENQIISETIILSDYQIAFHCLHGNPKEACKK